MCGPLVLHGFLCVCVCVSVFVLFVSDLQLTRCQSCIPRTTIASLALCTRASFVFVTLKSVRSATHQSASAAPPRRRLRNCSCIRIPYVGAFLLLSFVLAEVSCCGRFVFAARREPWLRTKRPAGAEGSVCVELSLATAINIWNDTAARRMYSYHATGRPLCVAGTVGQRIATQAAGCELVYESRLDSCRSRDSCVTDRDVRVNSISRACTVVGTRLWFNVAPSIGILHNRCARCNCADRLRCDEAHAQLRMQVISRSQRPSIFECTCNLRSFELRYRGPRARASRGGHRWPTAYYGPVLH